MSDPDRKTAPALPPAQRLEGLTLEKGWKVVSKHVRADGATGGRYSVCYHVERNGKTAFLKALDFSRIDTQRHPDKLRALQALLQSYNLERDILLTCAERGMNRVIIAIDAGEIEFDDSISGTVHYLVFDEANGDIRAQMEASALLDVGLRLRALHHIATGLLQLHNAGIAHQDLKPSNVLQFAEISKVSDLGSATVKGRVGPRDDEKCVGDKDYAPPELLYGYLSQDFNARRFGCDAYLLGSMVVFFFTGLTATASIFNFLSPEHRYQVWAGSYQEVLPYLRHALGEAVQSWGGDLPGDKTRSELIQVIRQLCDPDPVLRGHPQSRIGVGNPYSLERYVSIFDRLALSARYGIVK
jgi:serine/threonine protein kinase